MTIESVTFIHPNLDDMRYSFAPIPTIIWGANDVGLWDRYGILEIGWLCFGIRIDVEYVNLFKRWKTIKEWKNDN